MPTIPGPCPSVYHSLPIPSAEVEARAPRYPEPLWRARIKGEVRLRVTILPSGTVSSVCLVSGVNVLADRYTAQAAEQWRFVASSDASREAELSFKYEFERLATGHLGATGTAFVPPFGVVLYAAIAASN